MCYLCKHPDQGDDLAQQVFLTAWRTIRRLKSVGAFGAWLKRIMVTTWLEHARRTELAYSSAVDTAQLSAGNPTMSVGLDLEKALAELPSAMRLCVVLAYHEGMTHEEIATLSEMPLGTVKSNIARGSARLREFLAGYGVRDREDCYAK
jgi:RNA polymerase sigma-70 factor (ECF subfamily)